MEHLIIRLKNNGKAEDYYAFSELSEGDQERVNEVLKTVNI